MLVDQPLKQYDLDIDHIHSKLLQVGGLVERRFHDALQCFCMGDIRRAEKIIQAIEHVDSLEVALNNACHQLILGRHPAAKELRTVMATVKVIVELEQVGDEAIKIAGAARDLSERWGVAVNHYDVVRVIAGCTGSLLHDALDSFARLDARQAVIIIAQHRAVHIEFRSVTHILTTFMMEDPGLVSSALNTMWMANAVERIGEHAINVAECVIDLVEGRYIERIEGADAMAD